MKVKVFSKIGEIYTKIHEEDITQDDIERILNEWRHSDLLEIFDGDRLLFVYVRS
ncbi:MAG: hypothetical protein RXR43_11670 [Sulfolobus sp.]